jgi:hypothetical protein
VAYPLILSNKLLFASNLLFFQNQIPSAMLSQTRTIFATVTFATFLILGQSWISFSFPQFSPLSVMLLVDSHLDDDRIWRAEEVDQEPQPINYQQVKEWIGYPERAYQSGIQGDVTLRVLVDEKGEYVRHEVVDSFHPLLRIPCDVFTQLMVFKPAAKDGVSVKCWVKVEYHFEIPNYGK